MPGPKCYIPIVGNILSMWNEEGKDDNPGNSCAHIWITIALQSLRWFLACTENSQFLDEISEKHASPCRVWMGPNLYVFIHDADSAEQILKGRQTLNKPKVYEAISDVLGGDGLFSIKGLYNFNHFFLPIQMICVDLIIVYI